MAAGAYAILADASAGWTLRSFACTGATTAAERTPGGVLVGVDVTVAAGQQVDCILVRRAAAAGTATLTIRKEVLLPAGIVGAPAGQQFPFTGTGPIGDFALDVDPSSATPQERTFTPRRARGTWRG